MQIQTKPLENQAAALVLYHANGNINREVTYLYFQDTQLKQQITYIEKTNEKIIGSIVDPIDDQLIKKFVDDALRTKNNLPLDNQLSSAINIIGINNVDDNTESVQQAYDNIRDYVRIYYAKQNEINVKKLYESLESSSKKTITFTAVNNGKEDGHVMVFHKDNKEDFNIISSRKGDDTEYGLASKEYFTFLKTHAKQNYEKDISVSIKNAQNRPDTCLFCATINSAMIRNDVALNDIPDRINREHESTLLSKTSACLSPYYQDGDPNKEPNGKYNAWITGDEDPTYRNTDNFKKIQSTLLQAIERRKVFKKVVFSDQKMIHEYEKETNDQTLQGEEQYISSHLKMSRTVSPEQHILPSAPRSSPIPPAFSQSQIIELAKLINPHLKSQQDLKLATRPVLPVIKHSQSQSTVKNLRSMFENHTATRVPPPRRALTTIQTHIVLPPVSPQQQSTFAQNHTKHDQPFVQSIYSNAGLVTDRTNEATLTELLKKLSRESKLDANKITDILLGKKPQNTLERQFIDELQACSYVMTGSRIKFDHRKLVHLFAGNTFEAKTNNLCKFVDNCQPQKRIR